ncbi:hypothetical protein ABS767_06185 [Sphingomonas sp. ST-64]|uniref:Uncharacterized protein n=1 Tax=Sphingomonas plantiphila TaxID=3163295 RepID=A0ABW8YM75_9SPHN
MKHALTRIGLGLAAMGAGAVLFWRDPVPPLDPEKALAFASALAAWGFAEFFIERAPHAQSRTDGERLDQHDEALGKRLIAIASDDFVRFLRTHDFGGSFFERDIKPLYDLDDLFSKISSEFNADDLGENLNDVKLAARELSRMVAYGAAPKNAKASLFSMVPDFEADGFWSDATESKIQAANEKADDLANKLGALFGELRRRGLILGDKA